MLAALEAGIDSFESSFGELGGCPVPPGATGNIATEDLVSMLHEMGIETGIDLEALLACSRARARRARPAAGQPHAGGRPGRVERLAADVAALAAIPRGSASEGERRSAAWIAGRLREAGVAEVAVQPYRGHGTFAWVNALLALAALGAGRLPRRLGWPLAAAVLAALEGDASARLPVLRRLLPTTEGANVVGRIPARGPRRATVVLVAHHDTQRAGLVWTPALHEPGAARRLRTRSIPRLPARRPRSRCCCTGHAWAARCWRCSPALSVEQALRAPVPGSQRQRHRRRGGARPRAALRPRRRWTASRCSP